MPLCPKHPPPLPPLPPSAVPAVPKRPTLNEAPSRLHLRSLERFHGRLGARLGPGARSGTLHRPTSRNAPPLPPMPRSGPPRRDQGFANGLGRDLGRSRAPLGRRAHTWRGPRQGFQAGRWCRCRPSFSFSALPRRPRRPRPTGRGLPGYTALHYIWAFHRAWTPPLPWVGSGLPTRVYGSTTISNPPTPPPSPRK